MNECKVHSIQPPKSLESVCAIPIYGICGFFDGFVCQTTVNHLIRTRCDPACSASRHGSIEQHSGRRYSRLEQRAITQC